MEVKPGRRPLHVRGVKLLPLRETAPKSGWVSSRGFVWGRHMSVENRNSRDFSNLTPNGVKLDYHWQRQHKGTAARRFSEARFGCTVQKPRRAKARTQSAYGVLHTPLVYKMWWLFNRIYGIGFSGFFSMSPREGGLSL